MASQDPEEATRRLARRRVERKGFLIHLLAWAAVNLALVGIWRGTGGGFPWFLFPLGIWGIVLLLHFLAVSFLLERRQESAIRRTAIELEIEKIKQDRQLQERRRLKAEETRQKSKR